MSEKIYSTFHPPSPDRYTAFYLVRVVLELVQTSDREQSKGEEQRKGSKTQGLVRCRCWCLIYLWRNSGLLDVLVGLEMETVNRELSRAPG